MDWCKKDATPLLTHWSFVFLTPTHRKFSEIPILRTQSVKQLWLPGDLLDYDFFNRNSAMFLYASPPLVCTTTVCRVCDKLLASSLNDTANLTDQSCLWQISVFDINGILCIRFPFQMSSILLSVDTQWPIMYNYTFTRTPWHGDIFHTLHYRQENSLETLSIAQYTSKSCDISLSIAAICIKKRCYTAPLSDSKSFQLGSLWAVWCKLAQLLRTSLRLNPCRIPKAFNCVVCEKCGISWRRLIPWALPCDRHTPCSRIATHLWEINCCRQISFIWSYPVDMSLWRILW